MVLVLQIMDNLPNSPNFPLAELSCYMVFDYIILQHLFKQLLVLVVYVKEVMLPYSVE